MQARTYLFGSIHQPLAAEAAVVGEAVLEVLSKEGLSRLEEELAGDRRSGALSLLGKEQFLCG
jgi:hypothetical protein